MDSRNWKMFEISWYHLWLDYKHVPHRSVGDFSTLSPEKDAPRCTRPTNLIGLSRKAS